MNRRGFFSVIGAAVATSKAVAEAKPILQDLDGKKIAREVVSQAKKVCLPDLNKYIPVGIGSHTHNFYNSPDGSHTHLAEPYHSHSLNRPSVGIGSYWIKATLDDNDHGRVLPVGYVLYGLALNLSDPSWLPCDGSALDVERYPELAFVLSKGDDRKAVRSSIISSSFRPNTVR